MSFEKKFVVGFASLGLLAGIGGGLIGAAVGVLVMGSSALVTVWIFS